MSRESRSSLPESMTRDREQVAPLVRPIVVQVLRSSKAQFRSLPLGVLRDMNARATYTYPFDRMKTLQERLSILINHLVDNIATMASPFASAAAREERLKEARG